MGCPKVGQNILGLLAEVFLKDLPPPDTVPSAWQATEFNGKMFDSDIHLAGFLVYWLSFFMIPDFPYEGQNHTVFALAVSLVRGDFVPLGPLFLSSLFHRLDQILAGVTNRDPRSCDGMGLAQLIPSSALSAFAATCPCSLPALCTEGARYVLYRPDKIARQFGYDQGAPNPVATLKSYIESICRFTRAFAEELSAVPVVSVVYHHDISLTSPKARKSGWRGKSSYWAPSDPTPAATWGITIAEPISTILPPRVTRAKTKEQASSQQEGPQLKRLQKGAPTKAARTPHSEEAPLSVASIEEKRTDEESRARGEGFDSSVDDSVPISQSLKLSCVAQPSTSGKPVAKDKNVIELDEGGSEGTDSDAEESYYHGNDDHGSEEGEDSGVNIGSENHSSDDDGGEDGSDVPELVSDGENDNDSNADDTDGDGVDESLGADMEVQPEVEEDDEDNDVPDLIHCRKVSTEGFLTVPDINRLAPEATIQEQSPQVAAVVTSTFDGRINVLPADDLSAYFQAHEATVALANLRWQTNYVMGNQRKAK
ncbi:hypothetical protein RHGRI_031249 [Rhododendron griersonianum]|uniref:Aminotransferase-like plant mobile domain-containing protein n=1 Tax=Rhododendron griersonianum TaxID=479676 RepID=A0AAV6IAE2_9ERIC|nr:hypothetical protein RHGRI_031249 [Rhododendron griersonianum]